MQLLKTDKGTYFAGILPNVSSENETHKGKLQIIKARKKVRRNDSIKGSQKQENHSFEAYKRIVKRKSTQKTKTESLNETCRNMGGERFTKYCPNPFDSLKRNL